MTRCREASTEDEKAQHYINILISSAEYDTFVKLMRIMRPVAEAKLHESHRADSKHAADAERKPGHKGEADEESDSKAERDGKADEDEK